MAFFRGLRPTRIDAGVGGAGFVGALKAVSTGGSGGGGGGGGTVADISEDGKTCFRDGPDSSLDTEGAKRSCCGSDFADAVSAAFLVGSATGAAPRSKDFASLLVGDCLRLGAGNTNCGGAVYLDDAFLAL